MHDEYRLTPAPKPLRRRANRIVTATMLTIALALMVLVFSIEGLRFGAEAWLVIVSLAALGIGVARITYLGFTAEERSMLERSTRRVLDPLPPADAVEVPLVPNQRQIRRIGSDTPQVIAVTADALVVPGWLLHVPPRRVAPDESIHLPWADVTRFRVRADSDGPDLYEVAVRSDARRDPVWRIRRHEIGDEIVFLDAVRSVGGRSIDLEADISRPSARRPSKRRRFRDTPADGGDAAPPIGS